MSVVLLNKNICFIIILIAASTPFLILLGINIPVMNKERNEILATIANLINECLIINIKTVSSYSFFTPVEITTVEYRLVNNDHVLYTEQTPKSFADNLTIGNLIECYSSYNHEYTVVYKREGFEAATLLYMILSIVVVTILFLLCIANVVILINHNCKSGEDDSAIKDKKKNNGDEKEEEEEEEFILSDQDVIIINTLNIRLK